MAVSLCIKCGQIILDTVDGLSIDYAHTINGWEQQVNRYSEQNADERIAASEDRAREDMDALDLAEQLADESRDNPPLTESEYTLSATETGLITSATKLLLQRDHLRDTLRDIALGAQMMLEPALKADGTFKRYAEEVLRVARAGLKEAAL